MLLRFTTLLLHYCNLAISVYTDINGQVLTAGNSDSLDVNWSLLSKRTHFRNSTKEFSDNRYNGVAFETSAASCFGALIKTWVDINGTVPAAVVDQPATGVTVSPLIIQ